MPSGRRNPGESRGDPRLAPLLAATLALASAGVAPPTIAEDFDAALARLKAPFPGPGGSGSVARVGLEPYRTEAEALARAHGPAVASFLRSRLADRDRDTSGLASMTLAILARDPGAAAELTGYFLSASLRGSGAPMALTYAPPPVALAFADAVFARRDTEPRALPGASALYRLFGEAGHASALEARLGRPAPASEVRSDATADLVALRQRLNRPAAERPAWSLQDLIVWRALHSMPDFRGLDMSLRAQAAAACGLTRFTPAYLKDRLGASSIGSLELRLVLHIAALQREAAVLPELAAMVDARRGPWGDAKDALLAIGTRDALAPIERLITPPRTPAGLGSDNGMGAGRFQAMQRRRLVLDLCQVLARLGDGATLQRMEALAADAAYSADERAAFARTRDALRERLKAAK